MRRLTTAGVLVALVLLGHASPARAHAFQAALLKIEEVSPGQFSVIWKLPSPASDLAAPPDGLMRPLLPGHCRPSAPPAAHRTADSVITRALVDCGARGLRGESVHIADRDASPSDIVVRLAFLEQEVEVAVLGPDRDSLEIPAIAARQRWSLETVGHYTVRGVEHILEGVDHLAFVFGLLLLVPGFWALVKTITAFTLAHSLTLAAASLGLVHIPTRPVEASIALSIVLLAVELTRPVGEPATLTRRKPWLVSFAFGLLHGFGFAGALIDLGFPGASVPAALVGFNIGVELGQLAFVLAVALPLAVLRRQRWGARWIPRLSAYAIGALATAWTLERVLSFW